MVVVLVERSELCFTCLGCCLLHSFPVASIHAFIHHVCSRRRGGLCIRYCARCREFSLKGILIMYFFIWLFKFNIIILRFIHVVRCISGLFFLWLSSIHCMNGSQLVHPLTWWERHLGCFQIFSIINREAVKFTYTSLWWHKLSFLLEMKYPEMAKLYGRNTFNFVRSCQFSSKVVILIKMFCEWAWHVLGT